MRYRGGLLLSALLTLFFAHDSTSRAAAPDAALTPADLERLGRQIYLFAYPLVLMDVMREAQTTQGKGHAPMNQFAHETALPTPTSTEVSHPTVDVLQSNAWLDLSEEPMVLSLPDTNGRYYVMSLMDAWTNVFGSEGARTSGTARRQIVIVGPSYRGRLPAGLTEIRAPTNIVWLRGRTALRGPDDLANVVALQKNYKLTPLSVWRGGPPKTPTWGASPPSSVTPVERVAAMTPKEFLTRVAALLVKNPIASADTPMRNKLTQLGIIPGVPFEPTPAQQLALERTFADTRKKLEVAASAPLDLVNGWLFDTTLGTYNTEYDKRTLVALTRLGADVAADLVSATALEDREGRTLSGRARYILRFDKDTPPPVNAMWSVTMYDSEQRLVANPLGRYALGSNDALQKNPDGSIDLYIQAESPGKERESNWLPAPRGDFNLMMRLYWPKEAVLNGSWQPPSVRRIGNGGA